MSACTFAIKRIYRGICKNHPVVSSYTAMTIYDGTYIRDCQFVGGLAINSLIIKTER